jgi:hypothetical protein
MRRARCSGSAERPVRRELLAPTREVRTRQTGSPSWPRRLPVEPLPAPRWAAWRRKAPTLAARAISLRYAVAMPSFRRIATTTELPQKGARETPSLEFKAPTLGNRFELAKDVGGMASAYGGVILFGAASDAATEQLSCYLSLDEIRAAEAIKAYEEAVRDRCFPTPLIDPVRIPHPSEPGFIVAINVIPILDQPVGVKINGDTKDGFGGAAYVFHARLSTHNIPLRPDQLAMLMNPKIRRTAILLAEIPPNASIAILHRHPRNQFEEEPREKLANSVSVDLLRNIMTADLIASTPRPPLRIPLDDVETVWQRGETTWVVRVTGFFGGDERYLSNPSNALFKVR